jgi:hypothetical protein
MKKVLLFWALILVTVPTLWRTVRAERPSEMSGVMPQPHPQQGVINMVVPVMANPVPPANVQSLLVVAHPWTGKSRGITRVPLSCRWPAKQFAVMCTTGD